MENMYRVIMDHRTAGALSHDYLDVREGDLVKVLEVKGANYFVSRIGNDSSEEEEGYVPTCCVEPLLYRDDLNHNSNNNTIVPSNPEAKDLEKHPDSFIPEETDKPSCVEPFSDLQKDWSVFCLRTGRFEPFPNCSSEHELLCAKMDSLVKYCSSNHQPSPLGMSDEIRIKGDSTSDDESDLPNER